MVPFLTLMEFIIQSKQKWETLGWTQQLIVLDGAAGDLGSVSRTHTMI